MTDEFKNIFGKERDIVIGAIHLSPLVGFADFPGMDTAMENALADLSAFEEGGVDATVFENNYDLPHVEFVEPGTTAAMALAGEAITSKAGKPVGASVLWNDYKTAFSLAVLLGLPFIRVPVFVDKVKTQYGVIEGDARAVKEYQKKVGAENVLIFADIHVKHAELLSEYSLEESARWAIEGGADGLILTGKWTGDAPDVTELANLRKAIGDFPIIIGSGANADNIKELFKYANAVIVSTALKEGDADARETNVKPYAERIQKEKVQAFMRSVG